MEGLDFSGALILGADLKNSNLKKCNFERADLTGTNFGGSDLSSANFKEAILDNTIFTSVNISKADFKGANTCAMHVHRDCSKEILTLLDENQKNMIIIVE